MTDEVCPFCGAELDLESRGWKSYFFCRTGIDYEDVVYRGAPCYEAEISQLTEKLDAITIQRDGAWEDIVEMKAGIGEALEVLEDASRLRTRSGHDSYGCGTGLSCAACGGSMDGHPERYNHSRSCMTIKAQVLIPKLRVLKGETK